MTAPVARILLRYVAGGLLVLAGFDDGIGKQLVADPDLLNLMQFAVSGVITVATEWWYWAARKFGWSK